MAFPADPLDVKVEIALGADLTDPTSWSWTDISAYVYERDKCVIRRGRANEQAQAGPGRCTLTLDNTDGRFTRQNPFGAYYGTLRKNTPLRVRVDPGSGYVTRFVGYVTGWPPSWDPSEVDQHVRVSADGIFRRLAQGSRPGTPIYRTMIGVSSDDYQPDYYWPGEDGSDATVMAAAISGTSDATVSGTVTFAGDSTLTGSDPLPTFAVGATMTAQAATSAGWWTVSWWAKIDTEPSATVTLIRLRTTGGSFPLIEVTLAPGSPSALHMIARDSAGAASIDQTISMSSGNSTEANFYGKWMLYTLTHFPDSAPVVAMSVRTIESPFSGESPASTNSEFGTVSDAVLSTTFGELVSVEQPGHVAMSFGHVAVYATDGFALSSGAVNNVLAMFGYDGEEAHTRYARLCREEGVPATVTGSSSATMGPQSTATLLALLRECQTADQGMMYETIDGKAGYVCLSSLYNQAAALTLDYSAGEVYPPFDPADDDQGLRNDVTVARVGGAAPTVTDEASIARDGRYDTTVSASLETDDQARYLAGWLVNLGTVDELRYPRLTVLLHGSTGLIADWLATDLGDRVDVTGHPSPISETDIEQLLQGYTETLASFEWRVEANCSPASPYTVGVYGTDDHGSRYDAGASTLSVGVDDNDTSWSVATSSGPLWSTVGGDYPLTILVGGLRYTVTAVSGASSPQTFTVTRLATDKSHSAGAEVRLADPDRYAK